MQDWSLKIEIILNIKYYKLLNIKVKPKGVTNSIFLNYQIIKFIFNRFLKENLTKNNKYIFKNNECCAFKK